ncbi:cell division protein FtsW, lipid II flippase [Sporobacter termitidis DSM 10068]|uniref:Cell division protein FtsW, lipid II flippase n=1 Tax=Sporobacter termitidis DSM 10068 TaxID=1123282 RepID=A0A1M5VFS2_9FIRM|nr:FtsW/RodA/SpoVE family cell cycle protein [Sporobacter termitidis]SHH73954.1 cell division protein FtsW, lipid II flippase [Sporobacter termitidis DSM 10068]
MQATERIQAYSKTVCDQVRWKKAHGMIAEEIENHLVDQRDAYIAAGAPEDEATGRALAQMGDPVDIGARLDRTHRPKPQWSMLFLTAALLLAGLVIRLVIVRSGWDRELPVQLLAMAAGLGLMAAAYFADFTLIGRHPKTFFVLLMAAALTAALLSPLLNGRRYYAEFMTLLFPLGFSAVIYALRNKGYRGLIACCLAFLLPCLMALQVPTVAGLLLFAFCGFALLLLAIVKNWFGVSKLFGGLIAAVPFAAALLLVSRMFGMRLTAVLDPFADPNGYGYFAIAIREMLASARLLGPGAPLPADTAQLLRSPMTDTTQLLANLIHSAGWLAFIAVMAVLLLFAVRGFMLCARQKSVIGRLIAMSVMLTFSAQVFGYVLYNLGYPLMDPISLPLISYGNAAMMINLFLIGLMLSVFRTGDVARDKSGGVLKRQSPIAWADGKLIISFSRK